MTKPSRQQLGQWFTPEPVADLALALGLDAMAPDARILDPSCGDGVFLRRACAQGVAPGRLFGVDIDAEAIAQARGHVPGATLHHGDFFSANEMALPRVDLIVGNPPYVRHERVGTRAKADIVDALHRDWPELDRESIETLVGRSDLAAPFVLRLLRQLRPGGVAVLVLSSAFFDSGYGAEFWQLVERVASLRLVVDAPAERWFDEAAIHAVIAVFDAEPSEAPVQMARLAKSTSSAARDLGSGAALASVAELRDAARDDVAGWVAALRAPAQWLAFAEEAAESLVPLSTLARVRRGVTSGANEIFYLSRDQAEAWELDETFLRPLLTARGRGGHGTIEVAADELEQFALVVDRDCDLAAHPKLRRYLENFPDAAQRRTLRNRQPWWSLRTRPGQVFLCKAYGERFVQPFSAFPMVADQRMYCLEPADGVDPEMLSALLNATPTALALESLGRASMGQGALEWTVGDAASLPVLDVRSHTNAGAVVAAFRALRRRPVGKLATETRQSDRLALDGALLEPWPRLAAHMPDLQDALVTTCAARQARAKAGLR